MKPGGGALKGAEFERKTCAALSLWLSNGARADLLRRNVMSGGRFTIATKKEETERGSPGDVAILDVHPTVVAFLQSFFVECKHYASLELESFLFDKGSRSFLGRVIETAQTQALRSGLSPLIVAQQNRRPPLLICERDAADALLASASRVFKLNTHAFHNNKIVFFYFEEVRAAVRADTFIAEHRMRKELQ